MSWNKRPRVADRCPACGRVEVFTAASLQALTKLTLEEIQAHEKECSKGQKPALLGSRSQRSGVVKTAA
jgi:hypothetical protein